MATASDALDYFTRETERLEGLKAFAAKAAEAGGIEAAIAAQRAKLEADKNDREQTLLVLDEQIAAKTADRDKIATDLQTAQAALAKLDESIAATKAEAAAEAEKIKADAQAEADDLVATAKEAAAKTAAEARAAVASIAGEIEERRNELDQIEADKRKAQTELDDLQNKLAAFKASIGAAGA